MRCRAAGRVVAFALLPLVPAAAADPAAIEVGAFSRAAPGAATPAGWEPLTFPRVAKRTQYDVVAEDGAAVVRARADGSASGLLRRIEVDPKTYPLLAWRWKVAGAIDRADATRKEGDDYAARIYVAFRYDPRRVSAFNRSKYALLRRIYGEYPPDAGLTYVWDNRLPPGTILQNAYTERVRMIVVRSGNEEAGRWVAERRNVYEDYRRAFGAEPPPVSGVAVMTDGDDTGSAATAWYGDIAFRSVP